MRFPNVKPGQWWNAPPGQPQFLAYYLNLRTNYGMPAVEALDYARRNRKVLGIDHPGGMMGSMREAVRKYSDTLPD